MQFILFLESEFVVDYLFISKVSTSTNKYFFCFIYEDTKKGGGHWNTN